MLFSVKKLFFVIFVFSSFTGCIYSINISRFHGNVPSSRASFWPLPLGVNANVGQHLQEPQPVALLHQQLIWSNSRDLQGHVLLAAGTQGGSGRGFRALVPLHHSWAPPTPLCSPLIPSQLCSVKLLPDWSGVSEIIEAKMKPNRRVRFIYFPLIKHDKDKTQESFLKFWSN